MKNSRHGLLLLAVVIALLCASTSWGQEGELELVTDRPDQTESSVVVPPGFFQIEIGGTYTGSDTRVLETPGTLVRIGVFDRVELRLGTIGWTRESVGSASGFADSELGAKVYLWEEAGLLPETALLVAGSLPTGAEGFTSDRVDPSFRFAFSHTVSDRVSLGYNLGAAWTTEWVGSDRETLSAFLYTVTAGIGLTDTGSAHSLSSTASP